MADGQMIVASAVVVPEAQETLEPVSPINPAKRRQSSVSENGAKRRRLSIDDSHDDPGLSGRQDSTTGPKADRRRSGQAEERKRGQRLFGALLGTLSQSSSSTAQKRRADIEKKQAAKLKLQDEEFDQKQKEHLEKLMTSRRRRQRKFDEQSMRIRHSNLLATANFLQTTTEPKLYYKPWELRPDDEERIRLQVEEMEATIDAELQEFEKQRQHDTQDDVKGEEEADSTQKINGVNGDGGEPHRSSPQHQNSEDREPPSNASEGDPSKSGNIEKDPETLEDAPSTLPPPSEVKEHADDAGEVMVEAEEDTVIY